MSHKRLKQEYVPLILSVLREWSDFQSSCLEDEGNGFFKKYEFWEHDGKARGALLAELTYDNAGSPAIRFLVDKLFEE